MAKLSFSFFILIEIHCYIHNKDLHVNCIIMNMSSQLSFSIVDHLV